MPPSTKLVFVKAIWVLYSAWKVATASAPVSSCTLAHNIILVVSASPQQFMANMHSLPTATVLFLVWCRLIAAAPPAAPISTRRPQEKENMNDFIAKKREIFLVQMSLDTKRAEITKLEERALQVHTTCSAYHYISHGGFDRADSHSTIYIFIYHFQPSVFPGRCHAYRHCVVQTLAKSEGSTASHPSLISQHYCHCHGHRQGSVLWQVCPLREPSAQWSLQHPSQCRLCNADSL